VLEAAAAALKMIKLYPDLDENNKLYCLHNHSQLAVALVGSDPGW
jgi:hypothetical protein